MLYVQYNIYIYIYIYMYMYMYMYIYTERQTERQRERQREEDRCIYTKIVKKPNYKTGCKKVKGLYATNL